MTKKTKDQTDVFYLIIDVQIKRIKKKLLCFI